MGRCSIPEWCINRSPEELRAKREACERVRMENAARRNKTLPKVYNRAMRAAGAEEASDEKFPDWSIRANTEDSVVDEPRWHDERTPVEVDSETDTGTGKGAVSPLPAGSKSTPNSKHDHEADAAKTQQRPAKSCIGPRDMIDEGVGLASDDGDVARIHAANRKAWPRGQEPIAADGTAEDREIAELICWGLIGNEDFRVDHDNFEGDVCPYTVRFLEARRKGKKENSRRRQGVQVAGPAPWDAESDSWYLDDEAYAQLLSDGGAELVDWSEASSFVHVE